MANQAVALPYAPAAERSRKLGLSALVALVVGSMIGGGVFSLPQNMAKGAAPGPVLVGWLITGVGMLALAFVYQALATRKPKLDSGPYAYARAGFGDFVGFSSAWGYWLSAWIGNVSYAVLIFGTLSYFFPMFGNGNTWQAVLAASVLLWLVHGLILAGVREAALANIVTTVAKLVPIALFVAAVAAAFALPTFQIDFWGSGAGLGSIADQVKSTMLVTLWVFIGIEGASVVSARAQNRRDISRATIVGFLVALAAYVSVSMLSFGIMSQAQLAGLPDTASMADVLDQVAGPWGSIAIRVGLIVSVLGAFLSWTLFAAEIPFIAARDGIMPSLFGRENERGSASGALWVTNGLVQLFLIVAMVANSTYTALFYIASTAILVPYVLSGAYAVKLAATGESYGPGEARTRDIVIGAVATIYGAWLVYAAGPAYLLMCALLYAPGVAIYAYGRQQSGRVLFNRWEGAIATALVVAAGVAAWLMWRGTISPL